MMGEGGLPAGRTAGAASRKWAVPAQADSGVNLLLALHRQICVLLDTRQTDHAPPELPGIDPNGSGFFDGPIGEI